MAAVVIACRTGGVLLEEVVSLEVRLRGSAYLLAGNSQLRSSWHTTPAQRFAQPCPCRREAVKGDAGVRVFLAGNFAA